MLILAWNLLKHNGEFFCQLSYALNIYAFSIFPIYIFTLLELFSGGKKKMRVYRGRVEGPASPLLHGAAGWGVMTPCQLTNGQCSSYILYCIAKLTVSIQCNYKNHYICMSCSCNSLPWTICSFKIGVNKLIKGISFYIFMTHVCSARPLSARHVSGIVLHVVTFSLMCHA